MRKKLVPRSVLKKKYFLKKIVLTVDDTECFKQQIAFDIAKENGTVGKLEQRPVCDDEGFFKPLKCIPGEM